MNSIWKTFLVAENATFVTETRIIFPAGDSQQQIYPLTHLAILSVSGNDAGTFLQGQITCNVNDITVTQSILQLPDRSCEQTKDF